MTGNFKIFDIRQDSSTEIISWPNPKIKFRKILG